MVNTGVNSDWGVLTAVVIERYRAIISNPWIDPDNGTIKAYKAYNLAPAGAGSQASIQYTCILRYLIFTMERRLFYSSAHHDSLYYESEIGQVALAITI